MKLYNYYRSSASYRVRIALALKGLDYEYLGVHLAHDEHLKAEFAQLSAAHLVPVLEDEGAYVTQSLAIIEYLDETHPEPPLLPGSALERARIRAFALNIVCEIHPLNNLRVLRYLVHDLKLSEDDKMRWYRHWVEVGLQALEAQLSARTDPTTFCFGYQPTLADIVLVPQISNAQRFVCNLQSIPNLMRIFERCMQLDAFAHTQPSACPDAESV